MRVTTFIRHELGLELADLLEKVPTENEKEVYGEFVAIYVSDPDVLPADIRRIAKKAELINSVRSKARSYLRAQLQDSYGLSDEEFKEVMIMTTADIKANRIAYNKLTTMDEVIKIAANCAELLKKCGK